MSNKKNKKKTGNINSANVKGASENNFLSGKQQSAKEVESKVDQINMAEMTAAKTAVADNMTGATELYAATVGKEKFETDSENSSSETDCVAGAERDENSNDMQEVDNQEVDGAEMEQESEKREQESEESESTLSIGQQLLDGVVNAENAGALPSLMGTPLMTPTAMSTATPIASISPIKSTSDMQKVSTNVEIPPTLQGNSASGESGGKKKLSKNVIIAICIVSVLLAVGVALAIALPITFYYKDKVIVKTADDFVYESGKYFVLGDNVTVSGNLDLSNMPCNIDFKKHTLTVGGVLKLNTDNAIDARFFDSNVKIPKNLTTKDGNVKAIERGLLAVGEIQISAPSGSITFDTNVHFAALSATAKNIFVNNEFKGSQTEGTTYAMANFVNCPSVNIAGKAFNISLKNSKLRQTDGDILFASLDNDSEAEFLSTVGNVVGGKKVAILGGKSTASGVALLAAADGVSISNCDKIVRLESLNYTSDLYMSNGANGTIFAHIAPVFNAPFYAFEVAGKSIVSESNVIDVTSIFADLDAQTYDVFAYAKGNYDFEKLNADDSLLFTDSSGKKQIEYAHTISLSIPNKLAIEGTDSKLTLTFDGVAFADKYTLYIDGKKQDVIKAKGKDKFSVDCSYLLTEVGTHTFRVVAQSKNKQVIESDWAQVSYEVFNTLEKPLNLTIEIKDNKLFARWSSVKNATNYSVEIVKQNGDIMQLGIAASPDYFSELSYAPSVGDKLRVTALGYMNYRQGESATADMVKA